MSESAIILLTSIIVVGVVGVAGLVFIYMIGKSND